MLTALGEALGYGKMQVLKVKAAAMLVKTQNQNTDATRFLGFDLS
ncbi:MAG: hypothetical protein NW214_05015 [Pseudanabaenaceae cyanobacterium bins.39]|nr:hypothetical protein [Pseudanabaenaceae cyanobacterium bins.39]